MSNNTINAETVNQTLPVAIEAERLEQEESAFEITGETSLERLSVIANIKATLDTISNDGHGSNELAKAHSERQMRWLDAGVLAVAALLTELPLVVVQAKLHQVYGGKPTAKSVSKTIPNGDGEKLLKAAKAYNEVLAFVAEGTVPEAWKRESKSTGIARADIADMLDADMRSELLDEVQAKSKINVSDTVSRYFKELTPRAAPLWMNATKIDELTDTLLVNADYLASEEAEYIRAAYTRLSRVFAEIAGNAETSD